MIKIAITGNIASGKSTVEKIIESNGYKVYDTDKIAHEILANSTEVKEIFGTVDRTVLAKIVFTNKEKLQLLESIIHPQVKNKILEIFKDENKIVFISVPQLFETGFDKLFDKIIYVTAKDEIRKERLIKRNSLTPEEAQTRIKAQNNEGKAEKSDYIIENDEDFESLTKQVETLLSILI